MRSATAGYLSQHWNNVNGVAGAQYGWVLSVLPSVSWLIQIDSVKKQKTSSGAVVTRFPHPTNHIAAGQLQPWSNWPVTNLSPYHPYEIPPQPCGYSMSHLGPLGPASAAAQYGMLMPHQHQQLPSSISQNYTPHVYGPSGSATPWNGSTPGTTQHPSLVNAHPALQSDPRRTSTSEVSQAQSEFTAGDSHLNDTELPEDAEEYCEFTRPCSYVAKESEIDKSFSLGLISLKTARPSNHALPATWLDANPDPNQAAITTAHEPEKCPSTYHSEPCKDMTLLPIRESSIWNEAKMDPIFKILPSVTDDLITIETLRREYIVRLDSAWTSQRRRSLQSASGVQQSKVKKRIFSQTEHDSDLDSNKRHRSAQRPHSKSRKNRHERSSAHDHHMGRERRLLHLDSRVEKTTSIPHPDLITDTRVYDSTIGDNTQPTNDHATAEAAVLPTAAGSERLSKESARSEQATITVATPSLETASAREAPEQITEDRIEVTTAPALQPKSTLDDLTDPRFARESKWTRLARQYQAEAQRELEMMEQAQI